MFLDFSEIALGDGPKKRLVLNLLIFQKIL